MRLRRERAYRRQRRVYTDPVEELECGDDVRSLRRRSSDAYETHFEQFNLDYNRGLAS